MSESFVQAIYGIMTDFGPSLLATPRMFEAVLTQRCDLSESESAALIAMVRCGAVNDLWMRPETLPVALIDSAAARTQLPPHTVKWALEIWDQALGAFRRGVPPAAPEMLPSASPPTSNRIRQAIVAAALVAMVGTGAGAMPGILASVGIEHHFSPALRFRRVFEYHEPPGLHMSSREFAFWIGGLGALGGCIGSMLGWMASGFRNFDPTCAFFASIGALWAFDGAAFGAAHLGLMGTLLGSLVSGAAMTFVAALLGRLSVALLVKQLLWFIMPHF